MLVRELIDELKGVDPDAEVHMAYNYGDRARTTVAPAIHRVTEGRVRYSDYHSMDKELDIEDDAKSDDRDVVLLS